MSLEQVIADVLPRTLDRSEVAEAHRRAVAKQIANALRASGYDTFVPVRFGEHGRPLPDETYYIRVGDEQNPMQSSGLVEPFGESVRGDDT